MDFLNWVLDLTLKLLKISCAWMLIKYLIRHGKGLFTELLETCTLRFRVICSKCRKHDLRYLIQEKQNEAEAPPEEDDGQPQRVEATIL